MAEGSGGDGPSVSGLPDDPRLDLAGYEPQFDFIQPAEPRPSHWTDIPPTSPDRSLWPLPRPGAMAASPYWSDIQEGTPRWGIEEDLLPTLYPGAVWDGRRWVSPPGDIAAGDRQVGPPE